MLPLAGVIRSSQQLDTECQYRSTINTAHSPDRAGAGPMRGVCAGGNLYPGPGPKKGPGAKGGDPDVSWNLPFSDLPQTCYHTWDASGETTGVWRHLPQAGHVGLRTARFLNTGSDLGGTWPAAAALWPVDPLPMKGCRGA